MFRYYLVSGTAPLVGFAIAIPLAIFIGPGVGLLSYLLSWPVTALINKRYPAEAAALDGAEEPTEPPG